jgi:hypothetical protein
MNKFIDGYVINLSHDIKRKEHMINEFENTPINLKFFNAIKHSKGWIGCLKSHLKLIQNAKKNNMEFVLVMEDDCYIENKDEFNDKIVKIISFLKSNKDKWTIFHGGPNLNKLSSIKNTLSTNPFLFNVSKCSSTTFIIYNSNIYDFFINYDNIKDNELKNTHKIDMIIYNNLNCTTTFPCLIWQIVTFSNITNNIRNEIVKLKETRDIFFKRLIKKLK